MPRYWSFFVLLCLPVLHGCLQIELRGPVAGARIMVTPLSGGSAIVQGLRSSDIQQVKQTYGEDQWAEFSNGVKALFLGVVELPDARFIDGEYYLVTASGGLDMDADANEILDAGGVPVDREVHAIMNGAQLKQPFNRVTMLSEAIYRVIEPELDELDTAGIARRLNELSRKVLGDVNGDGRENYKDVLQWSHFSGKAQYKGAPELLKRLPRAIGDSLYTRDIVSFDSFNAVEAARYSPARSGTRWDERLVGCGFPVVYGDLCDMRSLSLLGMETGNPRIPDIMRRVVTSQAWMATRFEEVLNLMPEELLLLFRSVTSVFIGNDIRPSFYDPLTGSLYLDGGDFWLSPGERRVISNDPDPREEYASEVQFAHLWRYVRNNEDLFMPLYIASDLGFRQLEDIEPGVAQLLLHELAHAADYFRPALLDTIPLWATPFEYNLDLVSDDLTRFRPLQSDALMGVADVLFFGSKPTPAEAGYSAEAIGGMFAPDRASDLYSYSTQYEDLAMLFEEAMMQLLYGAQRDVAFINVPSGGFGAGTTCKDLKVGWGLRGRMAAPQVLERVKLVVAELLPEMDYSRQLGQLKPPAALKAGRNWCASIVLDSNAPLPPHRYGDNMAPRYLQGRKFL